MDGQVERTIKTLEDMLRACIIYFKGNWDMHFPLVEFAYNNSLYSSISMAPYEALYCRRCRSPIGWFEVGEPSLFGPDLIYKTLEKVHIIRTGCKPPIVGESLMPIKGEGTWSLNNVIKCNLNGCLDLARKRIWVLVMWVRIKY